MARDGSSNPRTHFKKRMILKFVNVNSLPLDLSIKRMACITCDAKFDHKDRFKAHLRRHKIKESGRYTCPKCNKKFVQQSSLITHMRIHTGERPFECKVCGNRYGDLSTFTKHKRIHSGERPYKCSNCLRKFSQSGNCLRHIRTTHEPGTAVIISETKIKRSNTTDSNSGSLPSSPERSPDSTSTEDQ